MTFDTVKQLLFTMYEENNSLFIVSIFFILKFEGQMKMRYKLMIIIILKFEIFFFYVVKYCKIKNNL